MIIKYELFSYVFNNLTNKQNDTCFNLSLKHKLETTTSLLDFQRDHSLADKGPSVACDSPLQGIDATAGPC